jgi:protein-tyrosine phosphatase
MLVSFPNGMVLDATGYTTEANPNPPTWGLYLYEKWNPPWPFRYVPWPDFGVPEDPTDADRGILDVFSRASSGESVQVGCHGGFGRTGTVLACLAVLAGVEPDQAVGWVRQHYSTRAVETPMQEEWVLGFATRHGSR